MATGSTVPGGQIAKTGDFSAFLKPEQAQDYFAQVEKTSIVQSLARKVPMGPTGITIPHWTGSVSAQWTGETERKPLTKGSFGHQELEPTKIAVIFAESAEVVRANPLGYLQTMRVKIAEAIALAFDNAALHGINKPTKFRGYLAETTQSVSLVDPAGTGVAASNNAYDAFVNGLSILTAHGKKWNGTLLDDESEPQFLKSKDTAGRPLFIESVYTDQVVPLRSGRILSRPVAFNDHVAYGSAGHRVLGVMGDFTQVIWGQVGGLSFDVTDQATLDFGQDVDGSWVPNLISLWQHNMVAVRCEAEYAFLVNDKDAFVKLTDTFGSSSYTLTVTGGSGGSDKYTLKVNGRETAQIAYNANASTIKSAIVAIDDGLTESDVTVTGTGPFTISGPFILEHGSDAGATTTSVVSA